MRPNAPLDERKDPLRTGSSMPNKLKTQEGQTVCWESDNLIVPQQLEDDSSDTKPGNSGEGKEVKLTRVPKQARSKRRVGTSVITRLDRITERASRDRAATFDNLYTLLNVQLLHCAFRQLKRGKAPGADGITVDQYVENLDANLKDLADRLHRKSYRPYPSVRRDIPKGNGKTRPLGLSAVEDKIVQRAAVMILERIYEVDFLDNSYGFRPNRSCHQALSTLGQTIATKRVNWISDADFKSFFDMMDHQRLLELLQRRIIDRGMFMTRRMVRSRSAFTDQRRGLPYTLCGRFHHRVRV